MLCRHCLKRIAVFDGACKDCQQEMDGYIAALGWRPDYEKAFIRDGIRYIPGIKEAKT